MTTPPTDPTPTASPAWASFVAAHYWKLLAAVAVALAGWGGYELSQAEKSVRVVHAGTTPPPRHQSPAFHHFEDLSRDQSKPAVVTLKGGGLVDGYFLRADETFVVLSTCYPQTGVRDHVHIPWDHVAHIRTHTATKEK